MYLESSPFPSHSQQANRRLGVTVRLGRKHRGHRLSLRLEPGRGVVAIPCVLGVIYAVAAVSLYVQPG